MFRFNLTPQRMRMIVEAFKESLELGLSKEGQIVVSDVLILSLALVTVRSMARTIAHDSHLRLWMAFRPGVRQLSCCRSW